MGAEVNLKHSGSQRGRELRQEPGDDVNNYSEHDHIAAYDHQILDGGGYRFAEHLAEAPSVSGTGIQCRLMDSPGQGCFLACGPLPGSLLTVAAAPLFFRVPLKRADSHPAARPDSQ